MPLAYVRRVGQVAVGPMPAHTWRPVYCGFRTIMVTCPASIPRHPCGAGSEVRRLRQPRQLWLGWRAAVLLLEPRRAGTQVGGNDLADQARPVPVTVPVTGLAAQPGVLPSEPWKIENDFDSESVRS